MFPRLLTVLLALAPFAAVAQPIHGPHRDPNRPARQPGNTGYTIYINANIYTLDPSQPRAEAMIVLGDRFVAAGSAAAMREGRLDEAEIVDLGGKTVLPGLIDAHGHVASLGAFGLGRLDLSRTTSYEEVVAEVAETVPRSKKGAWILGGRWDHESWTSRELPSHAELSSNTGDNPVWLRRVDGHAGLANAAAMKAAGITRDTPSPKGGEIIKDAQGEPTGIFVDNAMSLIERHVVGPAFAGQELILKAQEMCLSAGLTGVHDMGIAPADIDVYRRLDDEGRLKMRVYGVMAGQYAMKYFDSQEPIIGEYFTCRATKLYMDGAMGSRGAWLLEPYTDRPKTDDGAAYTGLNVSQPEFIEAVATHALQRGYQVCTHAIGDRANREVLYAYARAIASVPENARGYVGRDRQIREHRFRIEHAQLLSPADIPRFSVLGVVASMQPTHCTSDMRWVEARVGSERAKGAYAWASLLRSGAVIAAGSDFPVESHNPFLGIYAAITRQSTDFKPDAGWFPDQRMTREEAVRAFTLGAAYASFEESTRGSIKSGKFADFIVIDRDIMTCDVRDIPGTRVLRTVVGGETVFAAP